MPERIDEALRRSLKGKSVYKIAKETGLNRSLLSKFRTGNTGLSLEKAAIVAEYLGLKLKAENPDDRREGTRAGSFSRDELTDFVEGRLTREHAARIDEAARDDGELSARIRMIRHLLGRDVDASFNQVAIAEPTVRRSSDSQTGIESLFDGLLEWPMPDDRRASYVELVNLTKRMLPQNDLWMELPYVFQYLFLPYGWEWNGIYVQRGDSLRLLEAGGNRACEVLKKHGGVRSSGACWDAMLLNQPLMLFDVKSYSNYIRCDHETGIKTKSSIVVPIRDSIGHPVGVWDLDCTESVLPADACLGQFFNTLSMIRPTLQQALPAVG